MSFGLDSTNPTQNPSTTTSSSSPTTQPLTNHDGWGWHSNAAAFFHRRPPQYNVDVGIPKLTSDFDEVVSMMEFSSLLRHAFPATSGDDDLLRIPTALCSSLNLVRGFLNHRAALAPPNTRRLLKLRAPNGTLGATEGTATQQTSNGASSSLGGDFFTKTASPVKEDFPPLSTIAKK
eukprot:Trichotokara_eunicae@DN1255_c0_g1_i2.p1